MRILVVHNYYQQSGGEDAVVANEMTLLRQSGHEVELFTAYNSEISSLVKKFRTFKNTVYNEGVRRRLAEGLKRDRPDVVHVHNTFPLLSPSVYDACADASLPVVQTLHNFRSFCANGQLLRNGHNCELCLDGRPYRAIAYRCYRDSLVGSLAAANTIIYHNRNRTWSTKVTRFIALSAFARSKFALAGLPEDRIVVKPNFVDAPARPPLSHRGGILYAGRLSREKGVSHLINAISGTDIQLRILGDGPERAALERDAPSNVVFEGRVSSQRVREAMQSAKILVVPSICFENMPLSVVEAFANGLPVIASKLGSLRELVDDRVTGRLVAPADPAALKTTITEMLGNTRRLTAMGAAARDRYECLYTAERNIDQLNTIYEDAIHEVACVPSGLTANSN
jgi:glycosyltransferase involved in cell wall biosynthesis